MIKLVGLFALVVLFLPAAAIADDLPANDAKIDEFIDSRAFLDEYRINDMREETKGLSDEWKEYYYNRNRKSSGWAWLNFVVPSVGSWILGDKLGAIVNLLGDIASMGVFYYGYFNWYTYSSLSYLFESSSTFDSSMTYLWITLGGFGAMIVFDFISVISGSIYAGGYNSQLAAGLNYYTMNGINDSGRLLTAEMPVKSADMFHVDLLSFQF